MINQQPTHEADSDLIKLFINLLTLLDQMNSKRSRYSESEIDEAAAKHAELCEPIMEKEPSSQEVLLAQRASVAYWLEGVCCDSATLDRAAMQSALWACYFMLARS